MYHRLLALFTLLLCQQYAAAQIDINIPYSRIGLGELYRSQNFQNVGMSGLGASACKGDFVNFNNPASYNTFNYTNFEVGLNANLNTLSLDTLSQSSGNVSLSGLVMGFPLRKNGGLVLGFTPYSHVSYSLSKEITGDSVVGTYYQRFEGEGNLYQIFAGVGRQVLSKHQHQLSLGANAYYTFGNMKYTRYAEFPDTNNTYNTMNKVTINPRGLSFKAGALYRYYWKDSEDKLIRSKSLNIGATYMLGTTLQADRDEFWMRFRYNTNGSINYGLYAPDTISAAYDQSDKYKMPASISFGANFMDLNSYTLGFNVQHTMWNQFRHNGNADNLSTETRLSLGTEIIGKNKKNRLSAMYRAGLSYSTGYWEPEKGKKINELSASVGVGIPIVALSRFYPPSYLNIAVELGTRGLSASSTEIKDNYVGLHFGLTLNEHWFRKAVID